MALATVSGFTRLQKFRHVLGSGYRVMLHVWLIPALIIVAIVLIGFYLVVKFRGGSGVRSDGQTVVDKPDDEQPPVL